MQPSFLNIGTGARIAYHLTHGQSPCVMFMGGFKSDMEGSKATALEAFCKARGQRFIRFDYSGHGQSSGAFEEGTISAWATEALAIFDALSDAKNNILVGSSMGAWIALLIAQKRQEKVSALIGIASAPDFTEELIWKKLPAAVQKKLMEEGVYHAPSCYGEAPYPITRALIEDGRRNFLLGDAIDLRMPVRLLHGMEDEDVPWQHAVRLMECLASADVRLQLVKGAGHRLSEPDHLLLLCETVKNLLPA